MKIQESKKELAGVLLSPHDREKSNGSLGTLEVIIYFPSSLIESSYI